MPSDSRIFGPAADLAAALGDFHPTIMAGDPNGTPPDSPSNRVDPNTTTSPYGGVGSVQVNVRGGAYIGTGTLIDSTHVLTAAHVVDINNDGKHNSKDRVTSIYFILNFGSNQSHKIAVTAINIHPNYTGFNKPSVNDDLAVLTLAATPGPSVPTYALPGSPLTAGTTVTMVGYGQSGTGVSGYTVNASFTVKRTGQNNADAFIGQDDAGQSPADEVFRFDFDGPTGNGTFGGPTLGNDKETTLGGGDSGGPSFVGNVVVGVNTFTQGFFGPTFGTLGGGINVYPYVGWINSVTQGTDAPDEGGSPGKGGGNSGKNGNSSNGDTAAAVTSLSEIPAEALRRVVDLSAATNASVRSQITPPVIQVAPIPVAPRVPLAPVAPVTGTSIRTYYGYILTDQAAGDGDNGDNGGEMQAEMPPVNQPREVPPPPAPPPIPVPESEGVEQTPQSSWLQQRTAVFALAGEESSSEVDVFALAVEPAELPRPIFNSGAALAGLALLLGSVSARPASPRDPRRQRADWLR
ncbi:MAG: S1 family peptidase [Gemmataceae bacterium]|nr:S1 family peptidase [Gemmataceae bacterium]